MGAVHQWMHKNVSGALCQQEINCFIFKKVDFVISVTNVLC